MSVIQLIHLILAFSSAIIFISYQSLSESTGWEVKKYFDIKNVNWWSSIFIFIAIISLIFPVAISFNSSLWSFLLVVVGGFFLAFLLTFTLKEKVQYLDLALLIITFLISGYIFY